jgi:hypothetical protein
MSQFYDLASLVVIPSGYKASTIYAQKPLTTDGQLSFSRASTATRVNASGLIETVASNVPRLDYTNSSCPKILLEPQRSNLITRSETFENSSWNKYLGATVTANTVLSPDGTQNADTLNALASSSQEIYNGGSKAASAITYTFSCFAKYNGSIFTMVASDFSTSGTVASFNLQTGTVTSISVGATWSNGSAKIENYGNGWYRCIFTATSPATSGLYISLIGTTYIWGCQIEQGAYATSYVKTEAAAVTRVADAASKTGISSLIGQTEGTLYYEGTLSNLVNYANLLAISGAANSWIYMLAYTGGISFEIRNNNTVSLSYNPTLSAGKFKLALAYNASQAVIYINGTLAHTDNSVTIPACSALQLGGWTGYSEAQRLEQALLFKTRLTNAQLAELTTL